MNLPERFGKYLLVEQIAIGGMAEVFKAHTVGLGGFEKVLAVKRLHRKYCKDVDFIRMLIDEAKIAVQLSHSNICQIFDLDRIGEQYFIAMEYMAGLDLARMMRREGEGGLPIEVACFIAREVCAGLDYAHRKVGRDGRPLGIIHRDVSPQNVLVSWEGEVKIIDFGIAKAARRAYETESGIIKGKFYYMSPEHALGDEVDARSDVFSLGVVLYEMLTGELVYPASSRTGRNTLLNRVRTADIKPPSTLRADIPARLDQIVLEAVAKEPSERFPTAAAFGDALGQFLHQAYGRLDRRAIAEFLARPPAAPQPPVAGAGPPRHDHDEIMSRVDFRVDATSLIYDVASEAATRRYLGPERTEPDDDPISEGDEDPTTQFVSEQYAAAAAGEVRPMKQDDSFDNDPFFRDAAETRAPSRNESEIYELGDDDIDLLDDDPASDFDALDYEKTQIRQTGPIAPVGARGSKKAARAAAAPPRSTGASPAAALRTSGANPVASAQSSHILHGEAALATDAEDPLEHEPTRVYKGTGDEVHAILAASPESNRGPLYGEAPVSGARAALREPDNAQATVITTLEEVEGYPGAGAAAAAAAIAARRNTGASRPAVAPVPYQPPPRTSLSPVLIALLVIMVAFLGVAIAIGVKILLRDPTTTQIAAPTAPATAGTPEPAATASYTVASTPIGARIAVDGVPRGVTPASVDGLAVGTTYALRIERDGHRPFETQLTPRAAGPQAITYSLEPLLGQIRVQTTPPNAEVYVDEVFQNRSPAVIGGLDTTRTYAVRASLPGHLNGSAQVTWSEGSPELQQVSLVLPPLEAPAAPDLVAAAEPPVAATAAAAATPVAAEAPTARVAEPRERETPREETTSRERTPSRERETPSSRERTTPERTTSRERETPSSRERTSSREREERDEAPAAAAETMGRLSVRAEPDGQVFVNGQVVATRTPLLNHELEPGTHRVKVYFVELRRFSEERRVRVVAGETRSVYFRERE
jgi:serine/threonine protein kinase